MHRFGDLRRPEETTRECLYHTVSGVLRRGGWPRAEWDMVGCWVESDVGEEGEEGNHNEAEGRAQG
jgi:hypothetical protein